jgi:hypothetical protein
MKRLSCFRKGPGNLARLTIALTVVGTVVLALGACDDEVTPPQAIPGSVIVTLQSPNDSEGAFVLRTTDRGTVDVELVDVTLLGQDPPDVRAADGGAFHFRAGGVSRIVAYRDQAGEISLELTVEDVNRPPQWQIVEVAGGDNTLRTSLSGYEIRAVVLPQEGGS